MGPFLTWDTYGQAPADGGPPAGYIGANDAVEHKVTGSPTGFNAFRVQGPGLTGTCTDPDGTTVANCEQTDLFFIQGKVQAGASAVVTPTGPMDFGNVAAADTKTLTFTSTGSEPVTVSSVTVSGTDAADFAVANGCDPTVALDPASTCTIDVTYGPRLNTAAAATLTITDSASAAPRTIKLSGSSKPEMSVVAASLDATSSPSLAFGNQSVNTTSAEKVFIVKNTGPVAGTITDRTLGGFSAAHFTLAETTNTCGTSVAPKTGSCEIGVRFKPTTTGNKTADLVLTDSAGTKLDPVPLSGTGTADTQAPSAPTGVTATASGQSTINLSWSPSTDNVGVTGYRIFRDGSATALTTVTGTSYSDTGLTGGSTHSYRIAAVDAAGNQSPLSTTASATTAPADTTAPTLTARSPAVNAKNVSRTANITATFSEAVQNITTATFQLKTAAGTVITATVSRNATTNQWILDPSATLAARTQYTATLTGGANGITDLGGNPLANVSWSFTTGNN
jgi:hypothetical protein